KKVGTLPVNKLDQFVEYTDTLWFNPQQHYGVNACFPSQLINGQTNSLYFITIVDLVIRVSHSSYNGRKRYHGLFEYNQ
ncbi:dual OB domain-containing protein, partial [Escherichia coli]|uniref:dual OB domain-containing protein n=1 Tax=Escherichia coli TaxID=562 RepID=UPI00375538C3